MSADAVPAPSETPTLVKRLLAEAIGTFGFFFIAFAGGKQSIEVLKVKLADMDALQNGIADGHAQRFGRDEPLSPVALLP